MAQQAGARWLSKRKALAEINECLEARGRREATVKNVWNALKAKGK
jgi:hypothetical protein